MLSMPTIAQILSVPTNVNPRRLLDDQFVHFVRHDSIETNDSIFSNNSFDYHQLPTFVYHKNIDDDEKK